MQRTGLGDYERKWIYKTYHTVRTTNIYHLLNVMLTWLHLPQKTTKPTLLQPNKSFELHY